MHMLCMEGLLTLAAGLQAGILFWIWCSTTKRRCQASTGNQALGKLDRAPVHPSLLYIRVYYFHLQISVRRGRQSPSKDVIKMIRKRVQALHTHPCKLASLWVCSLLLCREALARLRTVTTLGMRTRAQPNGWKVMMLAKQPTLLPMTSDWRGELCDTQCDGQFYSFNYHLISEVWFECFLKIHLIAPSWSSKVIYVWLDEMLEASPLALVASA